MGQLANRISDNLTERTPVILQSEAAECGLVCLLMLAGHHGYHLDTTSARQRFALSINGMTLADIISVSRQIGLSTRAVTLDTDELSKLRLPCILHWDHNHFVVLTEVGKRGIVIHDPARGKRAVLDTEVQKKFTGVALEAWPDAEFRKKDERVGISVFDLLKRTAGIWRATAQLLAVSLLLEIIGLAIPIGFQIVLDEVIVAADRDLLLTVTLGLAGLLILHTVIGFIRSWSTLVLSSSLTLQWKAGLFDRLMELPLGFFEKRHVGDIVSRFGSMDQIQETLTAPALMAIIDGIMAVTLLAMMGLYGGWLVFIVIAAVVLYTLLRLGTFGLYRTRSEEAILHAAQENSHFMESVRGMSSVKALGLEERRRSSWLNHLVARITADVRVRKLDIIFSTASSSLLGADRILLIYFGALAIMTNNMSVGMLIAFLAYRDQFTNRIGGLVDAVMVVRMLSLHGERISDIALSAPEHNTTRRLPTATVSASSRNKPASLQLKNISFRYADNEDFILRDVTLDVRSGECIGITGPSGTGKSTLLKIAAGLNKPSHGEVLCDGVSVATIGLDAYRRQIACVMQNDRLFTGSIAENIASFADRIDMARVEECARIAAIHDEIHAFPMGYETFVGDMGSSLSGGQIQRIIIARALYRAPRILIMDEATSHLDSANEARINDAIRALEITRIIVAHRESSLNVADRVIRLGGTKERQAELHPTTFGSEG